jgi:two-component system response regulator GlrR
VGKRILVVDDDERILFVLEHALLSLAPDTEVITATNAAQALEQVSEVRVDLVLTDLRMPGQDGISLTSDLRLLIPTTPVIWVTAHHGPAVSEEARRLGVFGCLTKPADLAEIRAMARRALEQGVGLHTAAANARARIDATPRKEAEAGSQPAQPSILYGE